MKRIALLVCGMLLMVSESAEARWNPPNNGRAYSQPARVAPASYQARPAQPARVAPASYSPTPAQPVRAGYAAFSTQTAQGVANIMASTGRVGHWGGNTGYEGCGMGATPQAAFNMCCYSNGGMATVDVGYAQGANGMWYCCRRYR